MKTILSVAVALFITTATLAQQATDPTQDPTALNNAFFKALLDEDGSTLGKLLASDFSLTSYDAQTVDGDLLGQAVGGGYLVIQTATVSDIRTRQYNSDAAVVTGIWKSKGSLQGQSFDNNVAYSLVAAKQGNAWKIVNIQFTPIR